MNGAPAEFAPTTPPKPRTLVTVFLALGALLWIVGLVLLEVVLDGTDAVAAAAAVAVASTALALPALALARRSRVRAERASR